MDWNKIKTIFILTFLILDLFLVFQFIDKRNASSQLTWIRETKIEEQLQAENISYPDLSEEVVQEPFIRAEKKHFVQADLKKFDDQTISIVREGPIVSILDHPYPLYTNNVKNRLSKFIEQHVYQGEQYKLWKWDKRTNKLLLFQTYNGRMIFHNESGLLSIQLDEDHRIIGYEQTYLANIEEVEDEGNNQDILQAIRAIESLYRKNYLTYGNEVSKVELGYYKVVPLTEDVQFFAPTWHIQINDETNYFVNAIEGQIMELVEGGVENDEFAF